MNEYKVKFFARGCYLQTAYVFADSRAEAIMKVREENEVVEIVFCEDVRK